MKKIFTVILGFSFLLIYNPTANANAETGCIKMLSQAKKTCGTDHNCIFEALNAGGFSIVNTGSEVFCKGDPKKGVGNSDNKKVNNEKEEKSLMPVKDRSKSRMKDERIKAKSFNIE